MASWSLSCRGPYLDKWPGPSLSNGKLSRGEILGSRERRWGGQFRTGGSGVSLGMAQISWLLMHSFPWRQKPWTKSWHTEAGVWVSVEGWSFAARIFVSFATIISCVSVEGWSFAAQIFLSFAIMKRTKNDSGQQLVIGSSPGQVNYGGAVTHIKLSKVIYMRGDGSR